MRRKIEERLLQWKEMTDSRMPMLVYGARQVGKTYILKEFGQREYQNTVYINFESDPVASTIFDVSLDPVDIITKLASLYNMDIQPKTSLIILDEIQLCERAVTALKYFNESAPEFHIVGAGSLLGVAISREKFSFPVGKVFIEHLYPMDFEEYLEARGKKYLIDSIYECYERDSPLAEALHKEALALYESYLVVGGDACSGSSINEPIRYTG